MSKEVTRYDLRVTNDGAGLYATDEPNTTPFSLSGMRWRRMPSEQGCESRSWICCSAATS